jgi:ParB-like chromosome segregation protein Spo0J
MIRVPINSIKPNDDNPRKIDKAKFERLVQSIKDFPEMLDKRPVVIADGIILGGNMRHRAAKAAGMNEIPIIDASEWTQEQRQVFVIKDNISFGEWDWDILANEWDPKSLDEWGLDVWQPEEKSNVQEEKTVCECCGR